MGFEFFNEISTKARIRFDRGIESLRQTEDTLCCFRGISVEGCRLLWEVTSKCNLKCGHCFVKPNKKELSTKKALEVIEQLPAANVKKILFSGGEPLTREDIFKLIKSSVNKGIHVDLNTNAALINFKVAKKLENAGLREVTTSIDGANEKTHEKLRGVPGSFKKTVDAMKKLKEMGFKVDVVCVANKINKNEIGSTIDLAHSLGVDSITITKLILRDKTPKNFKNLELNSSELVAIKKTVDKKRKELANFPIRTLGKSWASNEKCNAGKGILYLDSQGILHPCSLLNNIGRQSVKSKKIKEILDSHEFKKFRKTQSAEKICPLAQSATNF